MLRANLCLLFTLVIFGCTQSTPTREKGAPADGKINVVAPDVNVNVEPKHDANSTGKVNVSAPGVEVKVEKK
jgi:hypothetical protein